MGRGVVASTLSEVSELSDQELGQQIASARARLTNVSNGALRKATEKQLRILEEAQKSREESALSPPRPVIPTEYRLKVWKSTGYPIGAEAISQALHDVPQYDYLKIKFLEFDDWSEKAGRPLRVLRAEFRGYMGTNYFGRVSRPLDWHIEVRAVPRAIKGSVKSALIEGGLPRLRQWLRDVGLLEGRGGTASIEFSFDDEGQLIDSEEKRLLPEQQ